MKLKDECCELCFRKCGCKRRKDGYRSLEEEQLKTGFKHCSGEEGSKHIWMGKEESIERRTWAIGDGLWSNGA